MKNNLVLSLGTNKGDRMSNLSQAIKYLGEVVGDILSKSSVYETEPWGKTDQEKFLNQVIFINSHLEPEAVLNQINHLEARMGREKTEKWGPRIIDVDILFFNDLVYESDDLTIPHPQLHLRKFNLVPLVEILPGYHHPILKATAKELLAKCEDDLVVKQIKN